MANDKCWAKSYCKKYGSSICNEMCDVYVVMKAIYSQTNIPKRYQNDVKLEPSKEDLPKYRELNDWKADVLEKVENGENLYIWGKGTGNGKTSWATKIANYYIRKMVFTKEIEDLVVFISVSKFLEDYRDNYKARDEDFAILKEKMMKAKLLILDDIGVEKPSEWVTNRLYDVINYRDGEELSIIYTSNISVDDLGERLDSRIKSRARNSLQVELCGMDRRGRE